MNRRRNELDFLKALGLLCIILAHVNPPQIVFQLRNFDVPMMVILSGMLARLSFEHSKTAVIPHQYIIKRFNRLVLPTWVFLVVYFAFLYSTHALPTRTKILRSFLLADMSIGYVWIVSVYMVCAVLTPFVMHFDLNNSHYLALFVTALLLHELLCHFKVFLPNDILNDLVYYIIPYGSMLILGLNYDTMRKTLRKAIFFSSLCIYAITALYLMHSSGSYVQTNLWKYPARLYYLSYAVAGSFLLLGICSSYRNCRLFQHPIILFISKSSFWIYLWHILVLKWITVPNTILRFTLVVIVSCLITYGQHHLISVLKKFGVHKGILSIFMG